MKISELEALVMHEKYTNIPMYNYYMDNPNELSDIPADAFITIPALAEEVKLKGIDALPQYGVSNLEEFLNKIKLGGFINLDSDVNLSNTCIVIEKDTTINLNGNRITGGVFTESNGNITDGDTDSYVFWVKGGKLTIEGNGTIEAKSAKYSIAVWANGGDVEINGGTFVNGDGSDLIYVSNTGNIIINDGNFYAGKNTDPVGTKNPYSALNIKDKDRNNCSIKVKGGTFYGFNPADNVSEGPDTNFVEEGYISVNISDNSWRVEKDDIVVDEL